MFVGIAVISTVYLSIYIGRRVGFPASASDPAAIKYKGDFPFFYAAAKEMREGGAESDIYGVVAPGEVRAGYIYPPLIAFLYQPLTLVDIVTAARISNFVNILAMTAMLAVAARAMLRRLSSDWGWERVVMVAVSAAILGADKIKGDLQMLQTNALVGLGLMVGLWLLDRHPWLAGLAIGFAMNIKYQALAVVVYLVFRRRWKALAAAIVGTVFWGLLPSVSIGIRQDLDYLARGFGGVLRLVGVDAGANVANVESLSNNLSLSIPSAFARLVERTGISVNPLLPAGVVAAAWLLTLALIYRRQGMAVVRWPAATGQEVLPWKGVVAVEWVAIITSVLAFSPQTNMRHMVLTVAAGALGVVIVLESRGRVRWVAVAGLVIMWVGLTFPPGNRNHPGINLSNRWLRIAGPCWLLLVSTGMLTYAGVKVAMRRGMSEREAAGAEKEVRGPVGAGGRLMQG
jgi:hypothetical protein